MEQEARQESETRLEYHDAFNGVTWVERPDPIITSLEDITRWTDVYQPVEIVMQIMEYMDFATALCSAHVCKDWWKAFEQHQSHDDVRFKSSVLTQCCRAGDREATDLLLSCRSEPYATPNALLYALLHKDYDIAEKLLAVPMFGTLDAMLDVCVERMVLCTHHTPEMCRESPIYPLFESLVEAGGKPTTNALWLLNLARNSTWMRELLEIGFREGNATAISRGIPMMCYTMFQEGAMVLLEFKKRLEKEEEGESDE